ncbi:MAG: phosphopantetheine-binding protein [Desulfobacterales bacterium]|nr:phosphopantetheine-binding protein [Desulfobacterales bacterium]
MTDRIYRSWTKPAVFQVLVQLLPRVAPLKVAGPVFPETSLSEDLEFDSLDAIDLLTAVNEAFSIVLDFEAWIDEESQLEEKPFTVDSLCRFIIQEMRKGEGE